MSVKFKKLNVFLATTATPHFPVHLAEESHRKAIETLKKNPNIKLMHPEKVIKDYKPNADDGLDDFSDKKVDLLILLQGTFTWDNIMMRVADTFPDAPVLSWALPERPFSSGVLELNSLCGSLMNMATLRRIKRESFFVYGGIDDGATLENIGNIILAVYASKNIHESRYGMVGYRPSGFYSSTFDELLIREKFTIMTIHEDLSNIVAQANEIERGRIDDDVKKIKSMNAICKATDQALENSSRLYLALTDFITANNISFLGVKCWPELMRMNLNTCMVHGRLIDDGIMCACEEDFHGALTMYMTYLLQGNVPWFADLIHIDPDKKHLYFWHCGAAPASTCSPKEKPVIDAQFRSPERCTTMEFPLKPGAVTVCRIGLSREDKYQVFAFRGEAIEPGFSLRGNCSEVIPEIPAEKLLEKIIECGVAHHYAIIYGDVTEKLKHLARILKIDFILAD